MFDKIKKWFSKGDEDFGMHLPPDGKANFVLKVDNLEVGILSCENGMWTFKYTEEFKNKGKEYNLITGFPDVNKEYKNESLWPFFRIRIPGLKQPSVQEILKKEHISQDNELELLKRFGRKTIANPYELSPM